MKGGDLIVAIEDVPVDDIDSFRKGMAALDGSRPFLVRARRGPNIRFLLIVPRDSEPRAKNGTPAPSEG
jgi:hypothetical protein